MLLLPLAQQITTKRLLLLHLVQSIAADAFIETLIQQHSNLQDVRVSIVALESLKILDGDPSRHEVFRVHTDISHE